MNRLRSERGGALILLLGIIAALAVMGVALVTLVGNSQSGTADDRLRAKSFNVAEAAIDASMAGLANKWPGASPAPTASPTYVDTATFRGQFSPTSEFPNPSSAAQQFVVVQVYDDLATPNPNVKWDSNGNDQMIVVAQSTLGDRSSRIQAKVKRTAFDAPFPRGVPVYTSNLLTSNGHGNNPKIRMGEVPPPGGTGTVYAGGTLEYNGGADSVYDTSNFIGVEGATGGVVPPLDEFFPQTLVDQIVQMATLHGRVFTSVAAAMASPADPEWSPTGGMSGLCVLQLPTGAGTVELGETDTSFEHPGLLLVLGGADVIIKGSRSYYGVVFCEGSLEKGSGTPDFYGMLIVKGSADLKGTPDIIYDDRCIANLSKPMTQSVTVVPNTWRQLQPVTN